MVLLQKMSTLHQPCAASMAMSKAAALSLNSVPLCSAGHSGLTSSASGILYFQVCFVAAAN